MDNETSQKVPLSSKKWESSDFSNRLKEAMKKSVGFNELAKRSGIASSTLHSYLNGRPSKIEVAIKLAEICNVDPIWLIFRNDFIGNGCEITPIHFNDESTKQEEIIKIPLVNVEASAGNGVIPPEWQDADMVPFSRDLAYQLLGAVPKSVFMMRVQGDSMSPTIHPKDILFVDYAPNRLTQGIYVMSAGELTLVKRLAAKDPHTFSIISDNTAYPSFDVPMERACWGNASPDADLRIVGRVIKVLHDFD